MATRPPAPDYSGRDYTSSLVRIQRLVQSVFPKWTDFNKANFGNMILKCLAFIVDIISKYTDFMATESLPEHAQLRRSVQAHSNWLGYKLSGRSAAQVTVTFYLPDGPHSQDVTILQGTLIRVADDINPITFQTLADVTILAGDTEADVLAEHSENAEDVEFSTGQPSQVYRLSQSPYIENTLSINAADGTYTLVENFIDSIPSDQHYVVELDDEERALVRFGDGVTGKIPEGEITFTYKVGGGLEGNIEAGTLIDLLDAQFDSLGDPIFVQVTNDDPAQNGEDPEAIEHAKQQAPASLRVLVRTVAREDYEIGAREVDGVATALFLTSDDTTLIRENEGVCWILALGSQLSNGSFRVEAPTSLMVENVQNYWRETKPKPLGFYARAVLSTSSIKLINVYATVHLNEKADKTIPVAGQPTNIGLAIFTALDEFFAVVASDGSLAGNVDWGFNSKKSDGTPSGELAWSSVFDVIRGVTGIRKMGCGDVLLNGNDADVPLRYWEFPQLGTVTIVDADTSQQLYPAI